MSNALSDVSFWFDALDALPPAATPPLPVHVDVAIVGAGFTGLWTAYYLKQRSPELRIAIFEAERVGFGASGRNGGWCMGAAFGVHGGWRGRWAWRPERGGCRRAVNKSERENVYHHETLRPR